VFAERGSDASLEEIAACYARWVPGSWSEPKRRGASVSTRRSTIALMMDGGYAPASTRP
jgi:hypothetical protein